MKQRAQVARKLRRQATDADRLSWNALRELFPEHVFADSIQSVITSWISLARRTSSRSKSMAVSTRRAKRQMPPVDQIACRRLSSSQVLEQ